jgi:hypothetical protein
MAADYLDFDLSIWSEGGKYYAKVIDSPSGTSEKVALRPLFPNQSASEVLLRVENAVLRARGRRGGPVSKEAKVLQEFGREVFNVVFRDASQIASQFASSLNMVQQKRAEGEVEGLRLKLRIEPPELALLPWEYVYDEAKRQHLCLQQRSPLVRFLDVAEPSTALEVKGPVNILGMIANPGGEWELLDTEKERGRIDAAIAPLQEEGRVNFRWVEGDTSERLMDMMQQGPWHVFHFIGHGGVYQPAGEGALDADEPAEGFIVLADGQGGAEEVSATDLSLMLQEGGSLRLAVLNCCESARGDRASTFSSPGTALVRSGVPAVVAMQFPISDDAAIRFASRFYKSVVASEPIEKAITSARVEMHLKSDIEWGIPVLFTRSGTGRLFSVDYEPQPSAARPQPRSQVQKPLEGTRESARKELRRLFGFEL